MLIETDETMPLRTSDDVVRVRQAVRARAVAAGFSLVDQTKIVTAASEIARNTVDYGGGGALRIEVLRERTAARRAAHLHRPGSRHRRHRPGAEGWLHDRRRASASGSAAPSACRTNSHITSSPGQGTMVTLARWK